MYPTGELLFVALRVSVVAVLLTIDARPPVPAPAVIHTDLPCHWLLVHVAVVSTMLVVEPPVAVPATIDRELSAG